MKTLENILKKIQKTDSFAELQAVRKKLKDKIEEINEVAKEYQSLDVSLSSLKRDSTSSIDVSTTMEDINSIAESQTSNKFKIDALTKLINLKKEIYQELTEEKKELESNINYYVKILYRDLDDECQTALSQQTETLELLAILKFVNLTSYYEVDANQLLDYKSISLDLIRDQINKLMPSPVFER
jgi:hypothetical protein